MCAADAADEFSYLGALILEAVVTELATLHGLSTASDVYLAGTRCVCVCVLCASSFSLELLANRAVVVKPRNTGLFRRSNEYIFRSYTKKLKPE